MEPADPEVAAYIARWRPSSLSPRAAAFARDVIGQLAPQGKERAKNLLWAAGKLADFGIGLGLEPVPEVVLHPSTAERFTRRAPGLSGVARRTLRTNLRFTGRRVVPQLYPADMPLPREHAKAPYSPAEIAGYLALADAQPTPQRRMRGAGLVCLGAGAGLIRADLRAVRGTDVTCRSGGVIVAVHGARPRAVPVLARYHGPAAGRGGVRRDRADLRRDRSRPPEHHHAADPVAGRRGRAAPAGHLPAARHLAGRRRPAARAGHVHARRRDHLLPAARRPARRAGTRRRGRRGPAARGGPAVMIPLPVLEEITDRSGIAPRIELLLPTGVRARQLLARTLLLGMLIVLADHRPAHLTRVHQALTTLPEDDQRRLGVIADWKHGPHRLTYRQTERTFGLVADALAKDIPDGLPSQTLTAICDDLLEASIPDELKDASTSLAVDWTDMETFSRPPSRGTSDCADPEASWGHRSGGGPGQDSELFFGYYPSAATMMRDEHGPPVPELARRMTACSCRHDPARALVPVLTAMTGHGIGPGDILSDSGYAHRDAGAWAVPLRQSGAQLVQDLHPSDRGPRGTHHGAIIANGNLYCPATPTTLLELAPLARDATPDQAAAHDQQTAETARHKLGKITTDDTDGYHRVMCPAVMSKIRCPLRSASMTLDRNRPEILTPPEHPPDCCHQQTITVPPEVAAKTRQKHDYPSAAHRKSYARRTGAERTFSTAKDPATNNIARGWTRLMGLTPIMLWLTCLLAVRNQRILTAWDNRQRDDARRAATGLPPKTRRRRRKTLASLTAAAPP